MSNDLPDLQPPTWTSVLVGYDGSQQSGDALGLGKLLAGATGARLTIAHVLPAGQADDRIKSLLEGVACERGADAVLSREESPGRGLQRLAVERGAELIVVGSSQKARPGRVSRGTTARQVLEGAPCAVAVAPRAFISRIGVVGVGYDGSVPARNALATAAELAVALKARLRVIGVSDESSPEQRGRLQDALDRALRSLPAELDASQDLLIGEPATVLAEEADEDGLELLVVGSRGRGSMGQVTVGSTGRGLLGSAPAAVLVAPLDRPVATSDEAEPERAARSGERLRTRA